VRDDNAIMEEASTCCLSLDDCMLVRWTMDVLYKVLTFGYIQSLLVLMFHNLHPSTIGSDHYSFTIHGLIPVTTAISVAVVQPFESNGHELTAQTASFNASNST